MNLSNCTFIQVIKYCFNFLQEYLLHINKTEFPFRTHVGRGGGHVVQGFSLEYDCCVGK